MPPPYGKQDRLFLLVMVLYRYGQACIDKQIANLFCIRFWPKSKDHCGVYPTFRFSSKTSDHLLSVSLFSPSMYGCFVVSMIPRNFPGGASTFGTRQSLVRHG